MKRRVFLQNASAFGAGLTILSNPRSAKTSEANDRVQMAAIGCGSRSWLLGRDFLARPADDVRFLYCCDLFRDRAENLAKELTRDELAPKVVVDAREIFDDAAVDGVVLATPDHWHALHTVWACQAGKDVYCEKPLSRTAFEGETMIRAAQKYGRIVGAGNLTRSGEYCLSAKKFIDSGELGRVELVRVHNIWPGGLPTAPPAAVPAGLDWDCWLGPAPYRDFSPTFAQALQWGYFWDFGNGILATQGVHQIDLARWLVGWEIPRSCYSVGGIDKERLLDQPPETQTVAFDFGSGIMTVDQTMNAPYMLETDSEVREKDMFPYWFQNATRVEIFGSKYLMVAGRLAAGWQVFDRTKGRLPVVKAQDYGHYTPMSRAHASDFIDAMRERRPANASVEECHKSTMLIHYANMSLRAGGIKLEIDPATGRVLNDAETKKFWRPEFRKEYDVPEIE